MTKIKIYKFLAFMTSSAHVPCKSAITFERMKIKFVHFNLTLRMQVKLELSRENFFSQSFYRTFFAFERRLHVSEHVINHSRKQGIETRSRLPAVSGVSWNGGEVGRSKKLIVRRDDIKNVQLEKFSASMTICNLLRLCSASLFFRR